MRTAPPGRARALIPFGHPLDMYGTGPCTDRKPVRRPKQVLDVADDVHDDEAISPQPTIGIAPFKLLQIDNESIQLYFYDSQAHDISIYQCILIYI